MGLLNFASRAANGSRTRRVGQLIVCLICIGLCNSQLNTTRLFTVNVLLRQDFAHGVFTTQLCTQPSECGSFSTVPSGKTTCKGISTG